MGAVPPKILIVDDELQIPSAISLRLRSCGFDCQVSSDPRESPLASRIIMAADSMDAMLMARSYKASYPIEKMLGELRRCAGTQFDPQIAEVAGQSSQTHNDLRVRRDSFASWRGSLSKRGSAMPKVLIVDDDENSRAVLIDALGDEGYVMLEAASGEDALRTVAKDPPDLVLKRCTYLRARPATRWISSSTPATQSSLSG